jgi:hypothetical protein
MEGLTYPSTYFQDGAVDLGNVYIIMDPMGFIVGVYRCPETAIEKAILEVRSGFLDSTVHVESTDIAIFVEGEKGKIVILVEQIRG